MSYNTLNSTPPKYLAPARVRHMIFPNHPTTCFDWDFAYACFQIAFDFGWKPKIAMDPNDEDWSDAYFGTTPVEISDVDAIGIALALHVAISRLKNHAVKGYRLRNMVEAGLNEICEFADFVKGGAFVIVDPPES